MEPEFALNFWKRKMAGKTGKRAAIHRGARGSNCVQVKGRVALKSPRARFDTVRQSRSGKESATRSGDIKGYGVAENTGFQKNPRDLWVAARMTRQITGFLPSRGGRMEKKPEKTKFSIRVDTELVELADAYIRDGTVLNRTELIGDALRFYLGFLAEKKAEDYLLQSLSSTVIGAVQDSENRLARMDFKIAVELSKLSQVVAYTHDVDEESLKRLHTKCVDEVRRINGAVEFESAYRYQKRES